MIRLALDIVLYLVVGAALATVIVVLSPLIAVYIIYTNWKEAP